MKKFIDRIQKFLFKRKSRQLSKDFDKLSQKSFSSSNSKIILGPGSKVEINAATRDKIKEVEENVSSIVKTTKAEPAVLLEYIRAAKTPIYRINNPMQILALIGEEEGFICQQRGWGALLLSLVLGLGIKLETEPMFVLRKTDDINKSYFLHNFYRWYSMKSGLGGFDYDSRKKLKMYMRNNSLETTHKLSFETIIQIQEAISREREANAFVLEYERHITGSKKVLDKIKNEGSADI